MSGTEFNGMLLTNADYLRPFALTLTRDNESARDLLQETMLRALVNKDKYNVGTNIKAWLYTIMRNIFINDYRKAKKFTIVSDDTPNEVMLNSRQMVVSNDAETGLALKDIKENIHQLPAIFKDPFVLYFEGYKYNEIANIYREPLGTIKSRIHFARKLLKQQMSRN
ncbi:MAG: RNA polymerase sigma factor [Sphingobacteriales bacterium]|nr:MAG: RNA polymerase sigma factor [Sphingobacteriales bacterium]